MRMSRRQYLFVLFLFICAPLTATAQSLPAGYDVVLLVGQSNMVGYGTGPDNAADAAVDPRVFMWDGYNNVILPAQDPLVQNQPTQVFVGLGMTFAKSYEKTIPANRKVLLVGSAQGSTTFISGRWQAPSGDLVETAVARANAAMAAAGPGVRFIGVLWHQGESDIADGGASAYEGNLRALISYFRANITGASASTPFVVGEFVYDAIYGNIHDPVDGPGVTTVLEDFHALPDTVNNTAWVSSVSLPSDLDNGPIHFSALSQRQLGRRYADKFFEAANNLPQPQVSMKSWTGNFVDDGRGLLPSGLATPLEPTNALGTVTGTVSTVSDPVHGNVAQISAGAGTVTYMVPATTLNASYTKVVWFKPGASGYSNNLISTVNTLNNQSALTYLYAATSWFGTTLVAGHTDAKGRSYTVGTQVWGASSNWMQLALTYDATTETMTLYLNGAKISSSAKVPPAATLAGTTLPVVFGGYGTSAGKNGVDGSMTGNRIWTTALASAQIQALYNYELTFRAGF